MCMKNQNVISFIVYRPRCETDMGRFRLRSRNQTTIPTPILESESESESFVVSLRWSRNRSQNGGDWNRSQNRGDWNRSRNCGDCNRIRMTIPIPHMYVNQYLI